MVFGNAIGSGRCGLQDRGVQPEPGELVPGRGHQLLRPEDVRARPRASPARARPAAICPCFKSRPLCTPSHARLATLARRLYCGSADGCKPVKNDFEVSKETTKAFQGSNVDLSACLKV